MSAVLISASPGLPASPRHAMRVLRVGAQVVDFVDRDQAQRLSDLRADPAQRRRRRTALKLRREIAQQGFGVERGLRCRDAILEPRDGIGEARGFDGFHEIVERAFGERPHRILIVCGHEHEVRATADRVRGFDARDARHVHVEKADVGFLRFEVLDRFAAVARFGDDLELRPCGAELTRERIAQQRLVVRDERSGSRASRHVARSAGISTSATTPRGVFART